MPISIFVNGTSARLKRGLPCKNRLMMEAGGTSETFSSRYPRNLQTQDNKLRQSPTIQASSFTTYAAPGDVRYSGG